MAEISKINANSTSYDIKDAPSRTALGEVINGGAAGTKNHCTQASGSNNPSSDRWINIPVSDVGVGQWVMSFGTLTSTDTDDTLCQAICFNSSNQQVSNWVNFKREANTNKVFTTTDNVAYVRLYAANSYATSAGDTVTFTNAMLCRKTLYDVNPEFEPYAPAKTNVEITPALVEVVDAGAKNCATVNNATYTNVPRYIIVDSICDKNCVLSLDSITSTDTNANTCALLVKFEDGTETPASQIVQLPRGTRHEIEFSFEKNVKSLQIYASDNYSHSGTTNTVTITNLMLCTKAAWDISHKFVPYCPSMQEMYQMILTLQNSTRSAPALSMLAEPEPIEEESR